MRELFQQALAKGWKILTEYPKRQVTFLTRPDRFVSGLNFGLWETKKDAFAVLVLGGTLALLINKINVHFYDERIQRVIEVQDKAANEVFLLVAVGALALFIFIPFRLLGGRASLVATSIVLMYAVAFTAPVATLLVVLVARLESAMLDAVIVVVPPLKIRLLSSPDHTTFSTVVEGAFGTILLLWNVYLCWILWFVLCTINQIGRLRGGAGLIIAVGLLFSLGGLIGRLVDLIVEPLRPVLEWIL